MDRDNAPTLTYTDEAPTTYSNVALDTRASVQPGQPVYADIDDINSGTQRVYTDVAKTQTVSIPTKYSSTYKNLIKISQALRHKKNLLIFH